MRMALHTGATEERDGDYWESRRSLLWHIMPWASSRSVRGLPSRPCAGAGELLLFRALDVEWGIAFTLINAGFAALHQGDNELAARSLHEDIGVA